VAAYLKEEERILKRKKIRTADWQNMYTEIRHETLKKHLLAAVKEASEHVCRGSHEVRVMWRKDKESADWTIIPASTVDYAPRRDGYVQYQEEDFADLVDFVLNFAFVEHDGANGLLRQRIGIPMGSLAAVRMANLYCYVPEARYMDQVIERGDWDAAREKSMNRRFVDDVFWVGEEAWPEDMYPHLKLSETTREDGSVVYLGIQLRRWRNGPLLMSVNDKEEELGLYIIRYPQATSAVPTHQIRGVMMSQLVRYKVICNNVRDFKVAVRGLVKRMERRGHPWRKFRRVWYRFLKIYWRAEVVERLGLYGWFQRMAVQMEKRGRASSRAPQ
jgi:hypothetical protein